LRVWRTALHITPNAATQTCGDKQFVVEVGDALDLFVALLVLRRLYGRILITKLADDCTVVAPVLQRGVLSFERVELRLSLLDLSSQNGVDPHGFRCEQEETHGRQEN